MKNYLLNEDRFVFKMDSNSSKSVEISTFNHPLVSQFLFINCMIHETVVGCTISKKGAMQMTSRAKWDASPSNQPHQTITSIDTTPSGSILTTSSYHSRGIISITALWFSNTPPTYSAGGPGAETRAAEASRHS